MRKALAHLNGALDVRMRLLGERYSGMCNMEVAGVYLQTGELDLALEHYQKALECHSQAANNGTVSLRRVHALQACNQMNAIKASSA